MPHAPCTRCGHLVLGGELCDLCATIRAQGETRRRVRVGTLATLAALCATGAFVATGHPAAAASFVAGLAVTGALWVAALPRGVPGD